MVENRQKTREPFDDDNGYGDVPSGAVGSRGLRGREYAGGYGKDTDEFSGGFVDDGRGGPRDDAGHAPLAVTVPVMEPSDPPTETMIVVGPIRTRTGATIQALTGA